MKKIIRAAFLGVTFISIPVLAMESNPQNGTQLIAPSESNRLKYMMLSEQARESPEARAALLEQWEKITFRDYIVEDLRRAD